ncbi:RraA family protein [Ensifer sp. YR511]|uniref:RraA family protein n=1 Tax=Ensifer sp. YR511 TaxID=1855294 RepID=UPI00088920C8|nr:RraA family protein [Ensifer sp. YR511]SDO17530.1 RraA famliy [Ensifer sp. YR511]
MTSIGFRVLRRKRKISDQLVERFRHMPVANISDCMNRMTAGGSRLMPLHQGGLVAGAAITVKTRPGDNLMVHKALDIAEPGDVVVVDAGGDLTNSIIGEIMARYAAMKGLGGIIIDGAVRDVGQIRRLNFPVFAAGATHRGPYKTGPGEINVPIAIEGMVIEPGDLIVGDEDGFVCVPIDEAERVLAFVEAKQAAEAKSLEDIAAGRGLPRAWIDEALSNLKCPIES